MERIKTKLNQLFNGSNGNGKKHFNTGTKPETFEKLNVMVGLLNGQDRAFESRELADSVGLSMPSFAITYRDLLVGRKDVTCIRGKQRKWLFFRKDLPRQTAKAS